jgi:hypothetical protein
MCRHDAEVQRMMVSDSKAGLIVNGPVPSASTSAEIDVLIVKEEIGVQTPELFETRSPQQEATAGHPGHTAKALGAEEMILAAMPRQR